MVQKQGLYCTSSSCDVYLTQCLLGVGRVTPLQALEVFRDCLVWLLFSCTPYISHTQIYRADPWPKANLAGDTEPWYESMESLVLKVFVLKQTAGVIGDVDWDDTRWEPLLTTVWSEWSSVSSTLGTSKTSIATHLRSLNSNYEC